MTRLAIMAAAAIAILPESYHGQTEPARAAAATAQPAFEIILRDEAPYFNPQRLKVPIGATVVWRNQGPALVHTIVVSTESGTVSSGSIFPGATWRHTFGESAIVKTACSVHPYMYGFVIAGDISDERIASVTSATHDENAHSSRGEILEFPLPVANSVPGIIAIDEQDFAWFTMGGGGWANINHPPLNFVGRLSREGDFAQFDLPTRESGPSGLTLAPSGMVFITQLMSGKLAKLDSRRRIVEEIPTASPHSWPTGLDLDRNGNLWFAMTRANRIGRLSPDGSVQEYTVPTLDARPTGIKVDREGNVWFAERDKSKLGCRRRDGTFVEYALPTEDAKPSGIAIDELGRIWIAERSGNALAVLEQGTIREHRLPRPNSGPFFLRIDYFGNVWFTETFGNRIGVFKPTTGEVTEYDIPTPDSWPGGLDIDSQGNVWFTEQLGNKVGVLLSGKRNATTTPPPARAPEREK
jgi:streptogramin lyase/plastocyanin